MCFRISVLLCKGPNPGVLIDRFGHLHDEVGRDLNPTFS